MSDRSHRDTIFVDDAVVLEHQEYPGRQYILSVCAPQCAATALPGSFAHITCDPSLPMRRPLSIMSADSDSGEVHFLYKIVGEGLSLLAQKKPGDRVSVMGPIGRPFEPCRERRRPLLIGGGVGIPPMIFLADYLNRDTDTRWSPLVLMGSELPFPFDISPSRLDAGDLPPTASHGLTLLESRGITSRLASLAGFDGCFQGFVTELARHWILGLTDEARDEVAIFSCGPTPMLEAAAALAADFDLPCQVSLEEFMACAVGGCAGCVVPTRTDEGGVAMKRVCVDGPVFEAHTVFPRVV
ncbi:MAG: dihydroorotate dehydrogenase electron transfer subunit [Gammaproteobacteria bacterium]